jgi:uncharacterized surface protein with fasciclin (FAS1) repeats
MKKILLNIATIFLCHTLIGQTNYTINAGSFYYSPSSLTINQGDIVTWINDGGLHDVNGAVNSLNDEPYNNPESFDSPTTNVEGAVIYTHTFDIPGEYTYDCSVGLHAQNGMVGQITVLAPTTTVVDIIVNSENHNTLETAVVTADLVGTLSGEGPFTVFAPTDDAFDALADGTLDAVLADTDLLTSILTHHVAAGSVLSTDLSDEMMVTTLNGTELMVSIDENGVMIDNAMVTVADLVADNGVVHVIDAVLIPEDCTNNDELVSDLLGTMFINDCSNLINYLVTNYGYSEFEACNWDGQPMFNLESTVASICECSCEDVEFSGSTVVDIIVDSENHNTLETAVIAADLVDALSGEGPFTVFAPTDDAFDALADGTLDAVLADTDLLTSILTHHVTAGSVLSTDLSDEMMVTTLNGTELMVTIDETGVMIDNAMVTVADLVADNGVVHVIDAVLIPETSSMLENNNFENDKYLYSIDMLGRKTNSQIGFIIDIYESGKSIKKYNTK